MNRAAEQGIFFEEHQPAAKTWWPWLLVPAGLLLIGQFTYGLFSQLVLGRPFGSPALPDGWFLALGLAMIALGGALIWAALKIRLSVKVSGQGLSLTYYPFMKRLFRPQEILSAEAQGFRPLKEYGGWGLRRSFKKQTRAYTMSGAQGVRLELKDSPAVLIGSQRAVELARAVQSIIPPR